MKVIILAAGQGVRLRPLTDSCPKCMVEVCGKSLIERQLAVMRACGIKDSDITIVTGYQSAVLKKRFSDTAIRFIVNEAYETTNMVYSLMCAGDIFAEEEDVLVSYGDIIYTEDVLRRILASVEAISVVVDDGWYDYWAMRCENPLDDAETLLYDAQDYLTEIGQKTTELARVQSQYIGLMRFKGTGAKAVPDLCAEAKRRSRAGRRLWRTDRDYSHMYMTDLLQGLIDEGHKLKAVHIQRGWFEIDDSDDITIAEEQLQRNQ